MTQRIAVALALAAAVAGCVPNDASVRLAALCSPPTPEKDTGCLYPAACETIFVGVLEANVANTNTGGALVWPVQVDNQRDSNADRSGGAETATAWIQGYEISYASGDVTIPPTSVYISDSPVPPGGSSVVIVPILPPGVSTYLTATGLAAGAVARVTADVVARGRYGDGNSFETGPMKIVFSACNGCAAGFTACPAATPTLVGVCPQKGQTAAAVCE